MGPGLSAALVAALLDAATAGAELGIRAEGQSATLSADGAPDRTRAASAATPTAAGFVEGSGLRLGASYAPRIWTSDVGAGDSPFVNHAVEARLETRHEAPWRALARAAGVRGRTDPLADLTTAAAASAQLPSATSLRYEELRAEGRAEAPLDERTTLGGGAGFGLSRALGEAAGGFPSQRAVTVDAALSRGATERDTVGLSARGTRTTTALVARDARADVGTALATWRRRFSPRIEAWVGGGATVASDDTGGARRVDVLPSGEAGVARAGGDRSAAAQLSVRLTTLVDRFDGAPSRTVDGALVVEWPLAARLALATTGFAGARTDGKATNAGGEVRLAWALRERLALEAGVRGRSQRDRRAAVPSFLEGAVFAGVAWRSGPLGRGEP